MNLAVVLATLVAAMPAVGRDIVLKVPQEPAEDDTTTKPSTLHLRATQVIRCVDARGALILQDVPCTPVTPITPVAPKSASAAPEVIELSALSPRPATAAPRTAPQEPEMSGFVKGLINGAWKLGLLVLACYALFRLVRAGRDRYHARSMPVVTRRQGPRRVN